MDGTAVAGGEEGGIPGALGLAAGHDEVLALAERLTGARFNSCLLNLYHQGNEGMGWHSDDEKSIVPYSAIASLSFGAAREFRFKHKHLPVTAKVLLGHGSLLIMKDRTQTHWLHSIPKSKKIQTPRINLTFRTMVEPGNRRT